MPTLNRRAALIRILDTMPDEAFSWFVMWAASGAVSPLHFKYPDGLGGFQETSRTAIEALQRAAQKYAAADV